MNIKPQLIEVYAIKNKSIITYSCGQSYTSYSKTQNLRIITKATSFISYGKPKIKQSSSLTTVPRTMQNQLYNTHPVANKNVQNQKINGSKCFYYKCFKKKKKTHLPKSVVLLTPLVTNPFLD